jgi:hypothetical protein
MAIPIPGAPQSGLLKSLRSRRPSKARRFRDSPRSSMIHDSPMRICDRDRGSPFHDFFDISRSARRSTSRENAKMFPILIRTMLSSPNTDSTPRQFLSLQCDSRISCCSWVLPSSTGNFHFTRFTFRFLFRSRLFPVDRFKRPGRYDRSHIFEGL